MLLALTPVEMAPEEVRPVYVEVGFTENQFQGLIERSRQSSPLLSPALSAVLERVRDLRESSISWACHLRLGNLLRESKSAAWGVAASLNAPLTFFKIERGLYVPKVIMDVRAEMVVDIAALLRMHRACRQIGAEFLRLQESDAAGKFLHSNYFKRAFNGAFFCTRFGNSTIFCPTLREFGHYSWRETRVH